MKPVTILACLFFVASTVTAQDRTYAERLGFPKGKKVVIMHVDDVGMSYESNMGAIETMEKGVASSCSIMMPCPWVAGFFHYLKEHPNTDAGLHLTLTSEWKDYRWGPISGKPTVPGLIDNEGVLWPDVPDVLKHSNAKEADIEIRAQIEKSLQMGFRPTHLDSHMGTLFATPEMRHVYLQAGIDYKIPVMFPCGHNTIAGATTNGMGITQAQTDSIGKLLWSNGLPVIDDLISDSYTPGLPAGVAATKENLLKYKTRFYIDEFKKMKPGITYVITHASKLTEVFPHISDSGPIRDGDYMALMSKELKAYMEKEGIIITTMRELMERRQKVK
ncbi:MAG: polysaccharide deacetylase family protein [Sphingobacteriales bacterium]|nr:polysaccharide deacetylase family protein [Sphingobacteriales bacterium]